MNSHDKKALTAQPEADQQTVDVDEFGAVKANSGAASSDELNLEELTQLWQRTPYDSEALLRSVQARSNSQRVKHYFEIGLSVFAVALLLHVGLREPLNVHLWVFVLASLPAVLWFQWLVSTTRQGGRFVQPHDAHSLLLLAMKQCQTEIKLAELTRKCCQYAALFGALWLPWLAISSWPLHGRDRWAVPFAFAWWIGWLTLMYAWAARKRKRERDLLKRLESWASPD